MISKLFRCSYIETLQKSHLRICNLITYKKTNVSFQTIQRKCKFSQMITQENDIDVQLKKLHSQNAQTQEIQSFFHKQFQILMDQGKIDGQECYRIIQYMKKYDIDKQQIFDLIIDQLIDIHENDQFFQIINYFRNQVIKNKEMKLIQKTQALLDNIDFEKLMALSFLLQNRKQYEENWVNAFKSKQNELDQLKLKQILQQPLIKNKDCQKIIETFILKNYQIIDHKILKEMISYMNNTNFDTNKDTINNLKNFLHQNNLNQFDYQLKTYLEMIKSNPYLIEQDSKDKLNEYIQSLNSSKQIIQLLYNLKQNRIQDQFLFQTIFSQIKEKQMENAQIYWLFFINNFYIDIQEVFEYCCNQNISNLNKIDLIYFYYLITIGQLHECKFEELIMKTQDQMIKENFNFDQNQIFAIFQSTTRHSISLKNEQFFDFIFLQVQSKSFNKSQQIQLFRFYLNIKFFNQVLYKKYFNYINQFIEKIRPMLQSILSQKNHDSKSYFEKSVLESLNDIQDCEIKQNVFISFVEIDIVILHKKSNKRILIEIDGVNHQYMNKQIKNFKTLTKAHFIGNLKFKSKYYNKFISINRFTWNNRKEKLIRNIRNFLQTN